MVVAAVSTFTVVVVDSFEVVISSVVDVAIVVFGPTVVGVS